MKERRKEKEEVGEKRKGNERKSENVKKEERKDLRDHILRILTSLIQ